MPTGLDSKIDRARRKVTALMGDTCRVFVDPDGNDSDTLDPDTLELVPPDPSGANIYAGPCMVTPLGTQRTVGRESSRGDADVPVGSYQVKVPYDAQRVPYNARVVILTSTDPQLHNLSLRVVDVERTSLLIQRVLVCEAIG